MWNRDSNDPRLRPLITDGTRLATTDPVRMEILSGARNDAQDTQLGKMLNAWHPKQCQG
jgi:hypothetical protein